MRAERKKDYMLIYYKEIVNACYYSMDWYLWVYKTIYKMFLPHWNAEISGKTPLVFHGLTLHYKCKSILFDILIFYLVKSVMILVLPYFPLFTSYLTLWQCKCKTCIPQGSVSCKLHWHAADDLLSPDKGTRNIKCLLCTLEEKRKRKRTSMPSLFGGVFLAVL